MKFEDPHRPILYMRTVMPGHEVKLYVVRVLSFCAKLLEKEKLPNHVATTYSGKLSRENFSFFHV